MQVLQVCPHCFFVDNGIVLLYFFRGNTEKAGISGFMSGGIPVFNKKYCTSFVLGGLYLADNSSSVEMNALTFSDEGMKLVITLKNPPY